MMELFGEPEVWLPLVFAGLMGLAILIYVVLDGFDLGVGNLLLLGTSEEERDRMIASIGPFWDANETWLVLAVGLLLVAFPIAHGVILTALYIPVALMLLGLIVRGVAFEFRAKAPMTHKRAWDWAFSGGSILTGISQGFMLGLYIMGLQWTLPTVIFAALTAVCLTFGYGFIGANWLVMKTEGALQEKAVRWAKRGLWFVLAGLAAVSLASPLVSPRIFGRWFSMPEIVILAPLPVFAAGLLAVLWLSLRHMPDARDRWTWVPFVTSIVLFTLAFAGLAYSFYPYVVPEQLTLYDAAAAPESLFIILVGALFVLPVIGGYTILAYTVFRGKATELRYD